MDTPIRIGELLLEQGRIDAHGLSSALRYQQSHGGHLGQILVGLGQIDEQSLMYALSHQLGIPYLEIGDRVVPAHIRSLVPVDYQRAHRLMPIGLLSENALGPWLVVAMADPTKLSRIDELRFMSGLAVKPVLAGERDLERAMARNQIDSVRLAAAR